VHARFSSPPTRPHRRRPRPLPPARPPARALPAAPPQALRALAQQAGAHRLIVITKRFNLPPYKVPPHIAAAVKAPYQLLRDLVVIEHPYGLLLE
jgi:hypothetical protein